jgi:hypothetical protein
VPRVVLYPQLEAQLARAVDPDLENRTDAVLRMGQLTAPVDTGAYKRSMRKIKLRRKHGGYRVRAGVKHAIYVEFGTRRMHGYRTLGNALTAAQQTTYVNGKGPG